MIEGILRSVLNHRSELTAGLTRKSRRRHTEGTNPQQPAEAPTTGRFIGKGIGRLNGDSGGWRLWKDRRHGFALRTEHTSYNSSAAAFSSEKAARLRRCAETQTFCTVWGSLAIVSVSTKKIEPLLAFLPARKSGSFELPRASFFGWIFNIGGGGGVQEGKIAERQPCILRKWPSFCHHVIAA